MIIGIIGNQGKGKTAVLARLALHYSNLCEECNGVIDFSKIIPSFYDISTFSCTCEQPKPIRIHANFWLNNIPNVHFVTCIADIDRIHKGIFLADELWTWLDSRGSGFNDVNAAVTDILMKIRKRGYSLIYESKRMHMMDRRIREMTDYVLEPEKYIDHFGQLVRVEENLLYPINMKPYLEKTWIVVDMLTGMELLPFQDSLFQFPLTDVVNIYDTNEEIKDIREGETHPGFEKGLLIEGEFVKALRSVSPVGEIRPSRDSKSWDCVLKNNGSYMCFDVCSPTKIKGREEWAVDVRQKELKKLYSFAEEEKWKPYFAWHTNGKWWVMPIEKRSLKNKRSIALHGIELMEIFPPNSNP